MRNKRLDWVLNWIGIPLLMAIVGLAVGVPFGRPFFWHFLLGGAAVGLLIPATAPLFGPLMDRAKESNDRYYGKLTEAKILRQASIKAGKFEGETEKEFRERVKDTVFYPGD